MQNEIFLQILSALIIVLVNPQFQYYSASDNYVGSIFSFTNVKNVCFVQGLQINEINVNLLQNTLNLADIKLCIAYMHTKKPLSYLFRKWNMLHWIKGRHCEFYITYITQALLISDNKCSFFASQQTMKKFFWSQSFLYPSIQYNHWFRRKHK